MLNPVIAEKFAYPNEIVTTTPLHFSFSNLVFHISTRLYTLRSAIRAKILGGLVSSMLLL